MKMVSYSNLLLALLLFFSIEGFAQANEPETEQETQIKQEVKKSTKNKKNKKAQKQEVKSQGIDWGNLVNLGPGVQNIKQDENGHVKTLVVVGTSRVSTVLGLAKGRKIATQRARLNAKAELVKWLQEKVSSMEQDQEETIIQLKGDGEKQTEEGKSTEHTITKVESFAEGMIRGMITLNLTVSEPEKDGSQTLSIILGWSAKNNQMAKEVRQAIDAPLTGQDSEKKSNSTKGTKTLPAQSFTAPNASEFE